MTFWNDETKYWDDVSAWLTDEADHAFTANDHAHGESCRRAADLANTVACLAAEIHNAPVGANRDKMAWKFWGVVEKADAVGAVFIRPDRIG
jgi:hypothetical protein